MMRHLYTAIFCFFIIVFLCFSVNGCGYTTSSLLPADLDSIYVESFTNEIDTTREISDRRPSYFSYTPGLENEITRAVIDGFIFDRHLDIDRKDNAALILKGSLVDLRQYPLSYDDNSDVEEYRIEIFVDIELYNDRTNELMWKEDAFMGQTNYNVAGPNKKTESQAQKDAVRDLAQRIVERTVEYW